jgi:hypothetical protein
MCMWLQFYKQLCKILFYILENILTFLSSIIYKYFEILFNIIAK